MPLIVRTHNYVPGALVVASQNNENENKLYNLVNGNLDADNFASMDESVISFDETSGHMHDGTSTGGRKINLSGAGPHIQADTTGTDHAILGTSSSAGFHSGIYGKSTTSSSPGGYFINTSTGVSVQATATGGGVALKAYGADGIAGDHAASFYHRSITASKAAIHISEATSTGYGLFSDDISGVPIFLNHTETTNVLQIDTDRAAGTCIDINSQDTGTIETFISLSSVATNYTGTAIIASLGDMKFATVTTDAPRAFLIQPSGAITADAGGWFQIGDSGSTITGTALRVYGDVQVEGDIGFYGASAGAKPTITGSRDTNAALTDLLAELATLGLITDSSSA